MTGENDAGALDDGLAIATDTQYPETLKNREIWVTWILDGARRKRPVAPWQTGHAYPVTWEQGLPEEERPETSFEEANGWCEFELDDANLSVPDDAASDELRLGLILPAERPERSDRITLIDWDDVRDPETGEIHPIALRFIQEHGGYVELSRSGEGLHQYVLGGLKKRGKFIAPIDEEPFVPGSDDAPQVEMYDGGRHVAMTGEHIAGADRDLVDGQELIDSIVEEYKTAEKDAGHRAYDPEERDFDPETTDTPTPTTDDYEGPTLKALEERTPEDRSLDYHAVVEAFYRGGGNADGYTAVLNWRLEGFAATIGEREGLSPKDVIDDLSGSYLDGTDVDQNTEHRTPERVKYAYERAKKGRLKRPTWETLVSSGILPAEIADTWTDDGETTGSPDIELTPEYGWVQWANDRLKDELGPDSIVPENALEHIAREKDLYGFDDLPEDAEELPPKAHNRALWWVNTRWVEDVDVTTDEDGRATARPYKSRDEVVFTWEDVRYIYDDGDTKKGRQAARSLLEEKYHFMTVAGSETLQLYDEETGVFNDDTGPINAEIYDGLGDDWSTHEKREIKAGLRQKCVVQPWELNARNRDEPFQCVENGVLNLFTRELHDHSPEFRFTSRIPVKYDPKADTTAYEEYVGELVARDADRKALFEMVGHALVPDANERYKKFLILTGGADNGKSGFYDRVGALLNGVANQEEEESNTSSVKLAKLAQNRFSMHAMHGSMANIAGEIDGKKIRNTANLKDITGGDQVEIEPKGRESIFDTINATLMFAANDPPILGERDKEAIASRIVPIELPYKFVDDPTTSREKQLEPERVLKERLETPEALSGFLRLALDGIDRLEENHGDVSLPESPEERLIKYERNADPMREFAEECLTNDAEDFVVKADVTTLYKEFAAQEGYEVGSAVEKVLHDVLRGAQDLNYTESRPRDPDYSDTSLPLRSWDSRKRVISRLTLTERGLELAEDAGITAEESSPDTVDSGVTPVDRLDDGEMTTITAELVQLYEENKAWYAEEGWLVDTTGAVKLIVRDQLEHEFEEGRTYRLRNVSVHPDDDGVQSVEPIPGVTSIEEIDAGDGTTDPDGADWIAEPVAPETAGEEETGDDADPDAEPVAPETTSPAATDGGEAVQVTELVQNLLVDGVVSEPITAAAVAGKVEASPEAVEHALESISNRREPLIAPAGGGEYRYL
jgi:P4 family phage/plasmid primase-like protien